MTLRTHIKETIKLALPISVGQLGHVMLGVVDSVMVGKVGSASLAAASLVNGIFFLILVIGIGLSMAATPLIAMAKGAGKLDDCGKILNHSLVVNSVFSILLITGTFGFSFLIPYLNQPREVVKEAVPYLQVLSISVIPFILFQTYRQFLEGLSIPNPPMYIAIFANLFNAFFNWIFIYGKFGFPPWGLFGAGVATTLTRWTMAAVLFYFVLNYNRVQIYKPQIKIKALDFSLIKKLISIGLPSGFQYFLEVAAFSFAAIMIGWLGKAQLAAHQIAINLASITYMIILGISSAGTIRVGEAAGKKDITQVRRAGFSTLGLASSLMFCFGVSFILLRNFLPTLYIKEIEVIAVASKLLIIAALFQIFDGLQATGIGVLRGLTDTKIPMLISFAAYWMIGIPIAIILGFYYKLGAVGIWIGLLIGLASVGITMLFRFNSKSKIIYQNGSN
ncbi:MAG: MATE family efflux transporter [Ignavibacteriales bacterium]|nr:MATE family efflux transporter [Ignavibacteriales bacterium]